jgi:pyrimidine deaminase RibD-like protein/very-short-patch-repair endonuclease
MRGRKLGEVRRARALRQSDNDAETQLWWALRNRNLNGMKFVRQFPIGPYFADFACRERRLVVELDGSQHMDNPRDKIRDRYMNALDWSVLRFWSGDALAQLGAVEETIAAVCGGRITELTDDPEFRFYPAMTDTQKDTHYMHRAIALAKAQMGRTWPNPSVGCVLVKDGEIVGEGATGDGGRPHAEEVALDQAGDRAKDAVAYVTLEPCGERSSGAPSCGQKLAKAQVARVVYACADPSPYASHKGPSRLADAGIPVEHGLCAADAFVLIEGFVHWLKTGLPLLSDDNTIPYDAVFERDETVAFEDDLKAWGGRGYRRLLQKSQS